MAGIQAAQNRLDAAVTRLEQAYAGYRRKLALQPAAAAAARSAVTGDQVGPDIDSLIRSLESTQRENTELTDIAETIGDRLDKTIERLQTVISGVALEQSEADAADDETDANETGDPA
jgi:division protein CdvB (Snf7/Vps24/ESCRT-III family)